MKLRIGLNANNVDGPYGGGNQFANTIEKFLHNRGHQVFRELKRYLDVILILSSQKNPITTSFDVGAISDYLVLNPNTVIVHRVNTCDEPRGSDLGINRAIFKANKVADYTVFVSVFIRELFHDHGLNTNRTHGVILNGADEEIFNPSDLINWQKGQKLKIVTHHWSTNYRKGFDIYERLDQLLDTNPFKDLFEFTYVGNLPVGVTFKNTRSVSPLHDLELAKVLKQHHVYVTAARCEPGGNHYVEAMGCGLPTLFLKSGSLPEYCSNYGVGFTLVDFEKRLLEMFDRYGELRQKVLGYSHSGTSMASQYEALFKRLVTEQRAQPRPRPSLQKRMWCAVGLCRKKSLGKLKDRLKRLCP
jgi:glycosyltransferase involved in cell wall biosynthesis